MFRSVAVAVLVLISEFCFLPSGKADATLPPVRLPPVALDNRAPQSTDDSSAPYPNGAQWYWNGEVWKLQDNTAGFTDWSRIEARVLPLDVVGLYVSAAAASAAGSGYNTGDAVWLPGGVKLTVATLTGGAGSGVATVTVTTPNMHACAASNPVAQASTSGSGSGATFNLTLLYPTAYGTRLLGRCYNGYALRAVRSDTAETRDIGFLVDGALDTPNLDAFAQGLLPMAMAYTQADAGLVVPRVSVWYDQGGQGNNATQATAAQRPTIFPGRRLGNARSVMFDAGTSTNWAPANTSLTLPAGVSVAGNASTVAALSGHVSQYQLGTSPVYVGTATAGNHVGIAFEDQTAGSEECPNGSSGSNTIPNYVPTDTPQWERCINGASSTLYANNTQQVTLSGGTHTGSSSAFTGGALGGAAGGGGSGTGLMDIAAVIVVPWALDGQTAAMLDAAIYRSFELAPQVGGMIVACCDSHVSGYGAAFQQSWPREAIERLGRRDLRLVNIAKPGSSVNAALVGTFWLPLTALQSTNLQRWLIVQGGYNDLNSGRTVAQVEADYATGAAGAHAAGAKVACATDVIRNAGSTLNANAQLVNAYLRGNAGGFCDLVIDAAAYNAFNAPSGPWNTPWFEQQDSGIHLSGIGNALWGALGAEKLRAVLQ